MKTGNVFLPSLDERACATIQVGRELSRLAEIIFPLDGPEADVMARTLRRLADRNPFEPTDEVTLRALRAILEAELAEEMAAPVYAGGALARRDAPAVPMTDDGSMHKPRVQELAQLLEVFDRFLTLREATLDQIAAERVLAREPANPPSPQPVPLHRCSAPCRRFFLILPPTRTKPRSPSRPGLPPFTPADGWCRS